MRHLTLCHNFMSFLNENFGPNLNITRLTRGENFGSKLEYPSLTRDQLGINYYYYF